MSSYVNRASWDVPFGSAASYTRISMRGVDRIGYAHSASKATAETSSDRASEGVV